MEVYSQEEMDCFVMVVSRMVDNFAEDLGLDISWSDLNLIYDEYGESGVHVCLIGGVDESIHEDEFDRLVKVVHDVCRLYFGREAKIVLSYYVRRAEVHFTPRESDDG